MRKLILGKQRDLQRAQKKISTTIKWESEGTEIQVGRISRKELKGYWQPTFQWYFNKCCWLCEFKVSWRLSLWVLFMSFSGPEWEIPFFSLYYYHKCWFGGKFFEYIKLNRHLKCIILRKFCLVMYLYSM